MDQDKGKWEYIAAIGRKVWVPDEATAPAEPVVGHWRHVPLDPSNQNRVTRAWIPVDQAAAGAIPPGALADGSGEWMTLPSGDVAFIPADQLERVIHIDGRAVRAYVPDGPAGHDHATDRGEWVSAIVGGPRGPVRRQVFIAHDPDEPEPREAGFVTGASACRLLGRSLSFLRAMALRGEVETRTAGKRVLYRERDVAALASGQSPTRIREAEVEEQAALMRGWLDAALPARSAGPATPAAALAAGDPLERFIHKYGRS